ncbi:DegV family protein [Lactobacillus ultunensis DSM 16047]|uniref:EDD domain protein, DegV family n=2 Tax=Lactobacillus ultunensis TaxID=227945 RepID=C2EMY7_9LACO|nr:EDD domain protein, DegV family [Lactobacillus ultunensis DSM 16047]KRL80821.1 DegV family protein [Lactobacillus ultunensis DSM 16047]
MTDSSVQLTPEEIKKYDITVVPLTITIDGKSYIDGEDITRSDFVKKMNEAENLPKTSQPPIGRFVDTIKKLTADGSQVIGIFLAKALSGTIDAARQAAEIAGQTDNVTIIDSELTDRAEGFQVLAAAKDSQAGKSMDEIVAHVKKIRDNQTLEMMVVNLKNLIKGGRLGALSGRIATMLNIRIVLQMPHGKLKVAKKGRGKKFTRAFDERVLKEIEENKDRIKEVGISYVDTPEPMHELADKIKQINPDINVLVAETSPIIATHAGNGAYAILFYVE